VHDLAGLLFQAFEDDDFGLELLDGLGGRGLIDDGLFEVLVVVGRQRVGRLPNVIGHTVSGADERLGQRLAALAQLLFLDAALELVAAALE
jgi:hypothetical protein